MKSLPIFLGGLASSALALNSAALSEQHARISAIEKVIQLLGDMKQKGLAEIEAEKQQYQKYFMFCHDTSRDKAVQIEDSQEVIDDAKNTVAVQTAKAEELSGRILEHETQIAKNAQDLENANAIRQKEKSDYQKAHQDYSESIDAVGRAIEVLAAQPKDVGQAKSMLIQLSQNAVVINDQRKSNIVKSSLLQLKSKDDSDDDDLSLPSTPTANAYESGLDKIKAMLTKLSDEFQTERTKLEKAESNMAHNHNMFTQDLNNDTENRESNVETSKTDMGTAKEAAAAAKKVVADSTATLESDKAYKADLDATCAKKANAFERRTQLRHEEIEAIQKAVDILSSGDVTGAGEKHGMIQPEAASEGDAKSASFLSFIQTHVKKISTHIGVSDFEESIRRVQKILTRKHGSHPVLANLAIRITTAMSDPHPFDKITKMIRNLIEEMKREAAEEAKQHAWCDKNLKLNEKDRKQFTKDVKKGEAKRDTLSAKITKQAKDIATLETDIAEASDALATATNTRSTENKTNTETIADAKAAQEAISRALVVLKEFYDKAAGATSLVQEETVSFVQTRSLRTSRDEPEPPQIFDEPYTGMGAESGGITGILEVIQSDFARLEAETTANESNASDEYEKFREETQLNLAVKKKDVEHTKVTKANDQRSLQATETALEESNNQLTAAKETFEKLKPPCIGVPVDYEARVKAREAEMKSLKECLEILEDEME